MAVTDADVRHIAALARLSIEEARMPELVGQLNGILAHMEVLRQVATDEPDSMPAPPPAPTPLRADAGPPLPLAQPRERFAPAMRDGFFLVPRLATHEDQAEGDPT